jgi:hypothetical protein
VLCARRARAPAAEARFVRQTQPTTVEAMNLRDLLPYRGQVVELTFVDGARVRAHVIVVGPDDIIYDALEILDSGSPPHPLPGDDAACVCLASDVVAVVPTGEVYARPALKPWWRLW